MNKLIKNSFIAVLVLATISLSWIWTGYQEALQQPLNIKQDSIEYSIQSGSSLSSVIYNLANKGIVSHPRYLLLHAKINGLSNNMQAGDYHLTKSLSTQDFLNNIFTGKVIQYSMTIIEGWSFKQLLQEMKKNPHIKQTINKASNDEIMQRLDLAGIHPEGQFLPDTYHFPKELTDIDFLKRAYHAMQKTLKQEWDNRAVGLSYKSPYEALIMASIVEKETGKVEEREQIAGVFLRRIDKRMRLQTDPTVIYGMGDAFKGNIRKRDLLKDTPYNTYRRSGLPPTPIALPGRDAIYAALHPADGDALYFVSKGDGSHAFSATLKEHNKAVIKYQLKGRARSFSSYNHKKKPENVDESINK